MILLFISIPQEMIINNTYMKYIKSFADINEKDVKILQAYTLDKKYYHIKITIDEDIEFNTPIFKLLNDNESTYIMKWINKPTVSVGDNKLNQFRMKFMKSCNLTEEISLEKMNSLIISYLNRQKKNSLNECYQLIELAYEYPGLLLPENRVKEGLPKLHISLEEPLIVDYDDNKLVNENKISIRLHSLMMEMPIKVLKTFYGCPSKLSQIYRSLFPNTWSQALFNFTTDLIIHPTYNEKMIVIVKFKYYHGYDNHLNTETLLDNLNTLQLLKNNYTVLKLNNVLKSTMDVNVPFPTIYGLSKTFTILDEPMDIKVTCYNTKLTFNNEIELSTVDHWKIPGDTTYGFITDKNGIDPHQYHYILRRLSRYLFDYPYIPYYCIMSEDDLPDDIMYFNVKEYDTEHIEYEIPYCLLYPMYE